jgi:hypothetical protein
VLFLVTYHNASKSYELKALYYARKLRIRCPNLQVATDRRTCRLQFSHDAAASTAVILKWLRQFVSNTENRSKNHKWAGQQTRDAELNKRCRAKDELN